MPDVFTKAKRSQVMAAIKSKGNKDTEVVLADIFRNEGIRGWRRNFPLPGKPDFVFPKAKLAVFIDGCFWHACPQHGRNPSSNLEYWAPKMIRNKKRDRAVTRLLKKKGWEVLRFWEHDLKNRLRITRKVLAALAKDC